MRFAVKFAAGAAVAGALLAAGGPGMAATHFEGLSAYKESVCEEQAAAVSAEWCAMESGVVTLAGPDGRLVTLEALVARTPAARAAGYQYVHPDVVARSAIFFVFERDSAGAFHMCNVRAPLDILWLRSDGRILDSARMSPGPLQHPALCGALYAPQRFGSYRFALEVPAGTLADVGITAESLSRWRLQVEDWMLPAAP